MGEFVKLKAADGHELAAYVVEPEGAPIGALVVVQEIFGVNDHVRRVADGYAKDGFFCVAPALFDRVQPGAELNYDDEGMKRGFGIRQQLDDDKALLDIAAAYEHARGVDRGTGVIGYCYGGYLSWLSATRGENVKMQPGCCVGYYAGGIGKVATEEPACPVMLHFGADDTHIGRDQIDAVRKAHPEVQVFLYDGAGHAFNRDVGQSFSPAAAKLARERTLEFLKANLA
jgi:carboxymethylenebutenolidase